MRLVTYATTESKASRLGALPRATDAMVDLQASVSAMARMCHSAA